MSDATETPTAPLSITPEANPPAPPTSLAQTLGSGLLQTCVPYLGCITPAVYSDVSHELSALTSSAGVLDRGHRVRVRITGSDRVRWLNGMVTNTVKALLPGRHNYTFILNAQGRIQGDAQIFAVEDALILETDRSQLARLLAHFDRFIIMDDVELAEMHDATTLSVAGPRAEGIVSGGFAPEPGSFAATTIAGIQATLVNRTLNPAYPQFDLWTDVAQVGALHSALQALGCTPCGLQATEALRVYEGVALFGIDIQEKLLPQETGQARALNFSKGCYLGQEIVERIRSRATIHRSIRRFVLAGEQPAPGSPLSADGAIVGELTSVAAIELPDFHGIVALGTIRHEVLEQRAILAYPGGTATALSSPPSL